jgi:hypothetical protein
MPHELSLEELKILTRVRPAPWIGIFWMCLAALLSVVATPKPEYGRWPYVIWAGLFLAGFVWFMVFSRWELERQRVLKAQEVRKSAGLAASERAAIAAEARKAVPGAIGNEAMTKGDYHPGPWPAPNVEPGKHAPAVSLPRPEDKGAPDGGSDQT